MSLRKQPLGDVPPDTARIAKAAFRKGNVYIEIGDHLGTIFDFSDFETLFPAKGQSAASPVLLALTTALQYSEGLSDRGAADAVRGRIDWKYLLRLSMEDPGFDHTVLSEFRARLEQNQAAELLFGKLIQVLKDKGLVKARGKQRTDSTHVFAAIRLLNRLELVHETMRNALEVLATVCPAWLRNKAQPDWYDRYAHQLFSFNAPKTDAARDKYAQTIGADGFRLLAEIDADREFTWLAEIPAVKTLKKVWQQQFTQPPEPPKLRDKELLAPSAERIASPHDTDARFSCKRSTEWVGYKTHFSETCDAGLPRIITNVETTIATSSDQTALADIHESLAKRELLPALHFVDSGYISADNLVSSQKDHSVILMGPPLEDHSPQSSTAVKRSNFYIDWDNQQVTCPEGKVSSSWRANKQGGTNVHFSIKDCRKCPLALTCTREVDGSSNPKGKDLTLALRAHHTVLQATREWAKTDDFRQTYSARAGVEGTISQAVRNHGTRKSRSTGLAKAKLQNLLVAVAINFTRIGEWMLGHPLAKTRQSNFSALQAA